VLIHSTLYTSIIKLFQGETLIMGCVYRATCNTTGKYYIGKTIGPLKERAYAHKIAKDDCVFHRALRKYEWDDFTWDILYEDNDEQALYCKERLFIKIYNSILPYGYNMTTGGDGNYSIECSDDWRFKNMERAYRLAKQIYCVELNKVYPSIYEAHYETDVTAGCITSLCNNPFRKAHKYHFCYAYTDTIEELRNRYICNKLQYGNYKDDSPIAKERRAKAASGQKWPPHMYLIMADRMSGERNPFYGKHLSEEQKARVGTYASAHFKGAGNPSAKDVMNLDTGEHFSTMKGAAEFYHLPPKAESNICSCCTGKLKTAYGYRWAYYKEGKDLQKS